jgi:predicted permease
MQRITAIPGVRAVGATSKLPLRGGSNGQVWAEDDPERQLSGGDGPLVEFSRVSGDYFDAMGIRLVTGRLLTADDTASGQLGAVINEEMARQLWPEEDPVGKRYSYRTEPPEWITVVGVVNDVRQWGPYNRARAENYLPYAALPGRMPGYRMFLVLHTEVEPGSVVGAVREAVLAVDPDQAISGIRTMGQIVSDQFAGQRFTTTLATIFATIALLLVAAGIYGVVSFHVARTTHEIGVRMALGAGRGRVLRVTLIRGLRLAALGVAIGVGGVFASTGVIRNMLYGADSTDVPTIIAGVAGLIALAGLASLFPAYRAASVSPASALRGE